MREWLAQEGYLCSPETARLKLWWMDSSQPPAQFPAGPWLVVGEQALTEEQRLAWIEAMDEESSLLCPWTPASLRPALRAATNPAGQSLLDSAVLARVYVQGGRGLADRVVGNFLKLAPRLLVDAQQQWQGEQREKAWALLETLRELAGGVGASDLEDALEASQKAGEPRWTVLTRELESAQRFLNNQQRQDRTV